MRIWMGWLILLPFAAAWWLTIKIVDACIKKGGPMRILGVIVSFLVGGSSIAAGYFIGPIVGWVIMGMGGLVVVIGTWRSVAITKPQVEHEELEELTNKQLSGKQLGRQDQEKWESMWISAKEEAKTMLKQDEINDYERFILVRSTLARHGNDSESYELYGELNKLEWKSTIKEAKRILEQGKIDMHNKKEREKFGSICQELFSRLQYDPEAKELWLRLQELKDNETRNRRGGSAV